MRHLDANAQYWFDQSMNWMDKLWDEDVHLLKSPNTTTHHTVRNTVWYALGLLQRGDNERAYQAIHSVLKYQYDTPDTVYHGTFKRSPLEPDPPPNPTEWKDYDPNWREFICTVFLVMLKDFKLPDDLQAAMWSSIKIASEGAYTRNVEAVYTNIALMSAFLLDHAGDHFQKPEWRSRAENLAQETYTLFSVNDTFWEYNSPTYYGTDLYALALWRDYGLTDTFKKLGCVMEEKLWQDIAMFYHAELRNLCGPYDRSYGMDMIRYQGLVGLYIALVVEPSKAPLPDPHSDFDHAHDFMFGPLVAYVGTKVPSEVIPDLQKFREERQLERTIETNRIATAYLSSRLMLGAETPHPSRLPNEQFHAATAHWLLPDNSIAHLRILSEQPFSARVEKTRMYLKANTSRKLIFEIQAGGLEADMLKANQLALPGLTIKVTPQSLDMTLLSQSQIMLAMPAGELVLEMVAT